MSNVIDPREAKGTRYVAAGLILLALLATFPVGQARAASAPGTIDRVADDTIDTGTFPRPAPGYGLAGSGSDPLGLIPYPDEVRRYTLGIDTFEVWSCPDAGAVPMSLESFIADAETRMTTYFDWLSDGRYDPEFIPGGIVPNGQNCAEWARDHAAGDANGALFIRNTTGGFAGPGFSCAGFSAQCPTTYPANAREGYIGVASASWSTLAHEMGHMLSWPHSFTGASSSEYDNAIDLMSGNYGTWTVGSTTWWGSYKDPFATTAINRYQAGWIDPNDVVVWDGAATDITLRTIGAGGTQMVVIDEGSRYVVLGARIRSGSDPFSSAWNGVEMYEVARCSTCWSLNAVVTPLPAVPFVASDLDAYEEPLPHVLGPGRSHGLCNTEIAVTGGSSTGFTVRLDPAGASGFTDVCADHVFHKEIQWLAGEGITRGCNPPDNSKFCPDAYVTREQMAAFLVRALVYLDDGGGNLFTDDDDSVFERDIDRLATAGVTKGCNPPANSRFCPTGKVTREQMAAFLVRALVYLDDGGGNLFTDDDDSVFERDIDRLATAGVTKGCNPPTNSRFCPKDYVTRGQMAAFLYRALGP